MNEKDLLVLKKRGTILVEIKDKNLTEVTIPDGVVKLNQSVFYGCKNLKHVHLPESVKVIRDSVFRDCSSLQSINLEHVQFIGNNAFCGCSSLQNISLSEDLKKIDDHSFGNCSSLEYVNLPTGLLSIGVEAFAGCNSLKRVFIGKNLATIKRDAFSGCSAIDSFDIDSENQSFTYANGILFTKDLKNVIMVPKGKVLNVDEIPDGADYLGWGPYCETFIRNGICVLGKDFNSHQFADNQEIVKLYVPYQVRGIDLGAFQNCKNLREIVFDKGIDYIEALAFEGCDALEKVVFPSSLTYIGDRAFARCVNLKRINIPQHLRRLLSTAFDGCVSLTDIDLDSLNFNITHLFASRSFQGIDRSKCTIHIEGYFLNHFEKYEDTVLSGFNIDKKELAPAMRFHMHDGV